MADVLMEYKGKQKRIPADKVDVVIRAGGRVISEPSAPPEPSAAPAKQEGPGLLDRAKAALDEGSKKLVEARKKGAETEDDLLTGGARGMTLGFDDVAAGVGAGLGAMTGGGEFGPAYDEGVRERRAKVEAARTRSPVATTVGELGGALATAPVGAAGKGAGLVERGLRGGVQGALAALGFGDADTPEEAGKDAAAGAVTGGALSALAPLLGAGVGKVVQKGRDVARRVLEKGGQRADELRVLTTMGATGGTINSPAVLKEVANVPGGVPALANTLRETGISRGITTTTGIAKRAGEVEARSGAAIGRYIDEATDAGGFVDISKLAARLRAAADDAVGGGKGVSEVAAKEARALRALADRFDDAFPGGVAPVRAAKDASIALADDAAGAYRARAADRTIEGRGRALMEGRRAAEAGVSDAIENLGLDAKGYQQAKTQFQAARLAREAAETSLGRSDKNNLLSLADATLAAGGAPGVAAAAGRKAVAPFVASVRATAAEQARAMAERLGNDPELAKRLGSATAELAAAAARGPAAMAAAHARLMNVDKAYLEAVKELEDAKKRQQALEGL